MLSLCASIARADFSLFFRILDYKLSFGYVDICSIIILFQHTPLLTKVRNMKMEENNYEVEK